MSVTDCHFPVFRAFLHFFVTVGDGRFVRPHAGAWMEKMRVKGWLCVTTTCTSQHTVLWTVLLEGLFTVTACFACFGCLKQAMLVLLVFTIEIPLAVQQLPESFPLTTRQGVNGTAV